MEVPLQTQGMAVCARVPLGPGEKTASTVGGLTQERSQEKHTLDQISIFFIVHHIIILQRFSFPGIFTISILNQY